MRFGIVGGSIEAGAGKFLFSDPAVEAARTINVHYCYPRKTDGGSPILFLLHGFDRAAAYFRDCWVDHAERFGLIVMAPEFDVASFPGALHYNQGNVKAAEQDGGQFNPRDRWTFFLLERLVPSRTAQSGVERLEAFIEAWGSYIPEIHGIAKALLAMKDTDEAAAEAWDERMQDMREGCAAAIKALKRDGMLSSEHSPKQATDILWTLLSVRNWEQLTIDCAWPQKKYIATLKALARRLLVAERRPRGRAGR